MSTIALRINIASGRENISVLVNNIDTIEEYIKSCEVLNEDLPFESKELSISEVRNLIDADKLSEFNNELESNGDNSTTFFKKVDISKVGIKKELTGYGKNGENDIYVYSENTGTVYYLAGASYDGNVYFSINYKITNIVK
jgi:hypothetical protein